MSKTTQAARPHLPPSPHGGPAEANLDKQIGILTKALEEALEHARAIDPKVDEFGHRASADVDQALRFAEMSGKLIKAKARLRGELKINYNVVRSEAAPTAAPMAEPQYVSTLDPDMPQITEEELHCVEGTSMYEMRILAWKIGKKEQEIVEARERLAELEEDGRRWNALSDEQKAFRKKLADEGHPLPPY